MISQNKLTYEFGGFALDPAARSLMRNGRVLELVGKEFDILCCLVENHDRTVTSIELAREVWSEDAEKYRKNLSHHIARIRKVLGCDARAPKFVRTIHWKHSYRFIAAVAEVESSPTVEILASKTPTRFEIACHLFVPVYLGAAAYLKSNLESVSNEWSIHKILRLDNRTLHILPNGFAVWHVRNEKDFDGLAEFAAWRSEVYREILRGRHALHIHTRELLKGAGTAADFPKLLGTFAYVFSIQVLRATTVRNPADKERILKLLSTPSSIAVNADAREVFEGEIHGSDSETFGLPNLDHGYATWDSLSYLVGAGTSLEERIVEFEIAVQSLWWMCKCITETFLNGDKAEVKAVRSLLPDVKRQFAKLKNISATESPSQRTMREAVLKTSRIREMVEEVIELSSDASP